MKGALTTIYFVGLVMFGIAIGSHTGTAQYAFMIIGGGAIGYAGVRGILIYLHVK